MALEQQGHERTEEELRELIHQAGLVVQRVLPARFQGMFEVVQAQERTQ